MKKNGFSLMELIIVMVIGGIIYGSMVNVSRKAKDAATSQSFLKYTHELADIACPMYLENNNIPLFSTSSVNLPISNVLSLSKLTTGENRDITPYGSPITMNYINMTCTVSFDYPKEFFSSNYLSFSVIKVDKDALNYTISIPVDRKFSSRTKSNYNMHDMLWNKRRGTFDDVMNVVPFGNENLRTNYISINRKINNLNPGNSNKREFEGLSYSNDGHIPDGQNFIR